MRNRIQRQLQSMLCAIALLAVLGIIVAACGGKEANVPQADEQGAAGGQRAQVICLHFLRRRATRRIPTYASPAPPCPTRIFWPT